MQKIWEFFENMNELVYVSDMDTYELLYMNKKARELGIPILSETDFLKLCREREENAAPGQQK